MQILTIDTESVSENLGEIKSKIIISLVNNKKIDFLFFLLLPNLVGM